MNDPASRRGFLRGLTTLPLVGGGVALIGAPSAVALPVTDELLDNYDAWLDCERRYLMWERHRSDPANRWRVGYVGPHGQLFDYVPMDNPGSKYHWLNPVPASSRAALVLSAVGCAWQRGGR